MIPTTALTNVLLQVGQYLINMRLEFWLVGLLGALWTRRLHVCPKILVKILSNLVSILVQCMFGNTKGTLLYFALFDLSTLGVAQSHDLLLYMYCKYSTLYVSLIFLLFKSLPI